MSFLTACGLSARGGKRFTGLPLISWQGARDRSLGEGRVRPIHGHRCPSVGLYVWRNSRLSHRIVPGIGTTHLSVRTATHSGRGVTGLSPIHVLMPPSHREVGDGRVRPVEMHWSVRRNNGLTRIGRQLTVIEWGAKKSSCRTTSPT
jgi:hypothetical protein